MALSPSTRRFMARVDAEWRPEGTPDPARPPAGAGWDFKRGRRMSNGWSIPETLATIELEEGPYAGAEIVVNLDVGLDVYFGILRGAKAMKGGGDEALEQLEGIVSLFADHALRGWNVKRGDQDVPATTAGLLSLGMGLLLAVIGAWIGAVGSAAGPLASGSRKPGSTAGASTTGSSPSNSTGPTLVASSPSSD